MLLYYPNNNEIPPEEETPPPEVPSEIVESPPKIDINQEILESMSLDEKIGQLIILGYGEAQPTDQVRMLIQEHKIGGFILFNRNYSNLESMVQTVNTLNHLNRGNALPLFLSVDEEGGTVSRLPEEGTRLPDARLIGLIDDPSLTYRAGSLVGSELSALGINMNYAPVLDIVTSKDNRLLIKRAFGSEASIVARHGLAFMKGLKDHGIIAVPKHYPGHGDTTVDSHGKLPKIMIDTETLKSRELIPFKAAIDAGVDALMVGHLAYPLIEPAGIPATKSKIFLEDILRKDLGYDGLIITDEIEMLGYLNKRKELSQGIIQSLQAGVDLFVIGHTLDIQLEVLNTIKNAVEEGTLTEQRINESVLRIIRVKNRYKLQENTVIDFEKAKSILESQEHKEFVKEILNKSSVNDKR